MIQEVRSYADVVSFILLGRLFPESEGKDTLLFTVFLCKNNDNYRNSQIIKKKLIKYKVQSTRNKVQGTKDKRQSTKDKVQRTKDEKEIRGFTEALYGII